ARAQRRSVRSHHRRDRQPAAQEARDRRSVGPRAGHHGAQRRLPVRGRRQGSLIMRRLGLVWRVALIVIAALVAIQMIAAAAYYVGPARGGESKRRPGLESFSQRPVRLVVPLADGEFIVAETVDDLTVRVLGLPPGFWAGIIGFLVAALALYAIVRETIPLSR